MDDGIVYGDIKRIYPNGFTVFVPYTDTSRLEKFGAKKVLVEIPDGRKISPEQRRKAYALIAEISEWNGEEPEENKEILKYEFRKKVVRSLEKDVFSLGNCSITTARRFISYLISFVIRNDVPTHVPLVELADDIDFYIYSCLIHKKCAVCGAKAELHHVDQIGMGNDRNEVEHLGRRCLPLCRKHHDEIHTMGCDRFLKYHHLKTGVIDEKIMKVYHLRGGKKSA